MAIVGTKDMLGSFRLLDDNEVDLREPFKEEEREASDEDQE
jgi:hypothetical protein